MTFLQLSQALLHRMIAPHGLEGQVNHLQFVMPCNALLAFAKCSQNGMSTGLK